MKMRARLAALIAPALLALLTTAGLAQSSADTNKTRADIDRAIANNIGDPPKFRTVMTALQQAVVKHDASAVAALVSYPITINPRTSRAMRVRTPEAFIANYEKIVTPHIAEIITQQKYEDLFVNAQGAMFGSGEIWIAGICRDRECTQTDIRIKTIQNTAGKTK